MGNSNERPANCRNRLRDEGKPYPRSGCLVCKDGGLRGCPYDGTRPHPMTHEEALAVALKAYRETSSYPIVPGNHDVALDAAITAYLSVISGEHGELVERLKRVASAADGSSLVAKDHLREAATALAAVGAENERLRHMLSFAEQRRNKTERFANERVKAVETKIADLLAALDKIEKWELPVSGRFHDDGTPISYSFAFGSNGERDFIRKLAHDAAVRAREE